MWKGAQDFRRVEEALKSREWWTMIVLTYSRSEFTSKHECYRAGVVHWGRFIKRLRRRWGKVEYVQTWEQHRSGWPHVHATVSCRSLFEACIGDGYRRVKSEWLEPAAEASGFGYHTYLEAVRDPAAMAGYLTKLARELTGGGKEYQIPISAPSHFRRLRASQGLLPPPLGGQDPDITGRLILAPIQAAMSSFGGIPGGRSDRKRKKRYA